MGSAPTQPGGGRSGKRRHRHHRRHHSEFRWATGPYGAAIIVFLILGAGGAMTWFAVGYFWGTYRRPESRASSAAPGPELRLPPWEEDVLNAFQDAAQQAKADNITGAEVQVDEAVAEMEEARVRSKSVSSDFFARASTALDDILKGQADSTPPAVGNDGHDKSAADSGAAPSSQTEPPDTPAGRLFQHVTQAHVELAAVRSWQEPMPPGSRLAVDVEEAAQRRNAQAGAAKGGNSATAFPSASVDVVSGRLKLPPGHADTEAPRELAQNTLLNPASLHAAFLDASLMPDTSEILLPPEGRQASDNVRVENLTIAGASQTIDGIHWRNVTFIETRLRYEDGPLDFQNVRFIHCTFGFPSDQRGATIASTIALGGTSLTIQ